MNAFAEKKGFDAQHLLRCSWDDMIPSEEDLVREPLLRELSLWPPPSAAPRDSSTTEEGQEGGGGTVPSHGAGVEETKGEGGVLAETKEDKHANGAKQPGVTVLGDQTTEGAQTGAGQIGRKKGGCIAARFEVLQLMNRRLRDALPYLDLSQVILVCDLVVDLSVFWEWDWWGHGKDTGGGGSGSDFVASPAVCNHIAKCAICLYSRGVSWTSFPRWSVVLVFFSRDIG